jgi:hypothetical protein
MNALKCPGNIWTNVTRVTPPSVYWSCATAVAIDNKERQSTATANRIAGFCVASRTTPGTGAWARLRVDHPSPRTEVEAFATG